MPALLEAIQRLNIPTELVDDTKPVSVIKAVCFITDQLNNKSQDEYNEFWVSITGRPLISRDENHARYAFKFLVQTILQDINRSTPLMLSDIIARTLIATEKHLIEYDFMFNNEQRVKVAVVAGVEVITSKLPSKKGHPSNKSLVSPIVAEFAHLPRYSIEVVKKVQEVVSESNVSIGRDPITEINARSYLRNEYIRLDKLQ